jgi:hypothetical protein
VAQSECRKVKFDSIGAKLALANANRPRARHRRREKRFYYCSVCKAFHLTSQAKQKDIRISEYKHRKKELQGMA